MPPPPDDGDLLPGGANARNPLTGDTDTDGLCPRYLVVGCCAAACCVGIEYGIIYPTIYPYLQTLGSYPALMMGLASAMFSLARTVMFVPLGALADRVGPRLPTALFFTIASLGNLYYFSAKRPVDVVVARAVVGLGSSVTSVLMGVVGRCVTDCPRQKAIRDRRLAIYNGTALLAILAGPGLAACFSALGVRGVLLGKIVFTGTWRVNEYDGPGLFMAVLTACCAVWAVTCLPNSPESVRGRCASIDVEDTQLGDEPMLLDGAPATPRAQSLLMSPTSGAVHLEHGFRKPRITHHARAALIGRRGWTSLVVAFVGGCMIATLDTAFPVVARDDFGAGTTLIAGILAAYAFMGVVAMVCAGAWARGAPEGAAGRKVRVVRVGLWFEVAGGLGGLAVFLTVAHAELAPWGLAAGAVVIFGAMFASNANIQLLAAVADMKRHSGFYSGLRSVFVCAGRTVGGFMAGILLTVDDSPEHVPVFAFILSICGVGLALWCLFPPRPAPLEDLEESLLSRPSDSCSETSSRRDADYQP